MSRNGLCPIAHVTARPCCWPYTLVENIAQLLLSALRLFAPCGVELPYFHVTFALSFLLTALGFTMEVLTEEESRLVMESMRSPFTKQSLDEDNVPRLLDSGQDALLIHAPGEQYKLTQNQSIPEQKTEHEILVKVIAVGLNPVDWKGPDYNFGLPSLPWINGRDLAGVVVKAHRNLRRIRIGDVILSPSTDYRDIRKAAFQEYVISTEHNSARVPTDMPIQTSAAIGVAFVTAALALGVCLGVNFATAPHSLGGPDLFRLVREIDPGAFANDIRDEVFSGIADSERAIAGDWIAIWGGQSCTIETSLVWLIRYSVFRHWSCCFTAGQISQITHDLHRRRCSLW